jgi:hypothetical protein
VSREALIAIVKATTDSPTALAKLLHVSPQRADQLLHPEKHKARTMVKQNLKPDRCQICQSKTGDLEFHHPDYNHPEWGIWACIVCHNLIG